MSSEIGISKPKGFFHCINFGYPPVLFRADVDRLEKRLMCQTPPAFCRQVAISDLRQPFHFGRVLSQGSLKISPKPSKLYTRISSGEPKSGFQSLKDVADILGRSHQA